MRVDAAALLGSDLPEGAIAVTDHQTAGRGRLGRALGGGAGDAPCSVSVLLRPPPAARAGALARRRGRDRRGGRGATGLSAQIKWPNDVMLDRRKVAGILVELRDGAVVVGIGLNVNQTRDQLPRDASRSRLAPHRDRKRARSRRHC